MQEGKSLSPALSLFGKREGEELGIRTAHQNVKLFEEAFSPSPLGEGRRLGITQQIMDWMDFMG